MQEILIYLRGYEACGIVTGLRGKKSVRFFRQITKSRGEGHFLKGVVLLLVHLAGKCKMCVEDWILMLKFFKKSLERLVRP